MQNLNTASRVKCPTCARIVSVERDADDQIMCSGCGENIGWTLGKSWERAFDTFYDGRIPECFQVTP